MAVLVTGAGLLGAQVAAKLVERGDTTILYDIVHNHDFLSTIVDINRVDTVVGDLLDLPLLLDTIKQRNVDRIIHTAGLLDAGVKARPYSGIQINILGTLNILEAAKLAGVKRVVFTSSIMVQSGARDAADTAYREDFTMKCLSQMPVSIYGITKLTAEYLGLSYHKIYSVDFAALRVACLFGPWLGKPSGKPSQFIDMFVKNATFRKPVIIDDPTNTYSGVQNFVYVKDVAKGCVLACFARELKSRVYNISGDRGYKFQDVIDITKRVFPQIEIRLKEISKIGWGNQPAIWLHDDTSKAQNEFGYQPDYDLESAFKDYAEWLRRYAQPPTAK